MKHQTIKHYQKQETSFWRARLIIVMVTCLIIGLCSCKDSSDESQILQLPPLSQPVEKDVTSLYTGVWEESYENEDFISITNDREISYRFSDCIVGKGKNVKIIRRNLEHKYTLIDDMDSVVYYDIFLKDTVSFFLYLNGNTRINNMHGEFITIDKSDTLIQDNYDFNKTNYSPIQNYVGGTYSSLGGLSATKGSYRDYYNFEENTFTQTRVYQKTQYSPRISHYNYIVQPIGTDLNKFKLYYWAVGGSRTYKLF